MTTDTTQKRKNPIRIYLGIGIALAIFFISNGVKLATSFSDNRVCVNVLEIITESTIETSNLQNDNALLNNYCQEASQIYLGEINTTLQLQNTGTLPTNREDLLIWLITWQYIENEDMRAASTAFKQMRPEVQKLFDDQIKQLAVQSQSAGDFLNAQKMFELMIAFYPSDPWRYENLSQLYQRQNKQIEAINVFVEGSRSEDGAIQAYLAGRAAESQGRWEEAVEYFQRAIIYGDTHPLTYFHIAQTLGTRLNNPEEAIPFCIEATRQAPQDYACYELLGSLYEQINTPDRAKQWYLAGLDNISRSSYRALFLRRLGDLAYEQTQYAQSIDFYQQSVQEKIVNPESYHGLALASVGFGDGLGALSYFKVAFEQQQSKKNQIPVSWYKELGDLYKSLEQTESALQAYRTALLLNPDDDLVRQEIERLQKPK